MTRYSSSLSLAFTGIHQAANRGNHLIPAAAFARQLFPAGRAELVVLRALIVVRHAPFGSDPSLFFEAMQRRVQRPGFKLEHLTRSGPDRLTDAVAVLRPPAKGLEDEHVQRSLEQLDPVAVPRRLWHGCRHSTPKAGDCLRPDVPRSARASRSIGTDQR